MTEVVVCVVEPEVTEAVVSHHRTGVTGCGLFIASSFVMDQLAEEQEIDVVMAVSTVRKSRPQFIGSLVSSSTGAYECSSRYCLVHLLVLISDVHSPSMIIASVTCQCS